MDVQANVPTVEAMNTIIDEVHSSFPSFQERVPASKGATHRAMDLVRQLHEKNLRLVPRPQQWWLVFAVLAGLINLLAACLQVKAVVDRRSAEDFSWYFLSGMLVVNSFWGLYAFGHGLRAYMLASSVSVGFLIVFMVLKAHYGARAVAAEQ